MSAELFAGPSSALSVGPPALSSGFRIGGLRLGFFLLLLCGAMVHTPLAAREGDRQAYIQKYRDLAVEQMRQYKIPASITLAQACLESGNGSSPLALQARNHFGIKCGKGWEGKTYYQEDDRPNECFRSYKRVEDSYEDHALFLTQSPRYHSLFAPGLNYQDWARGLQEAGYATNPNYARLLVSLIEQEKLYLLDDPAWGAGSGSGVQAPLPLAEGEDLFFLPQSRPVFRCNGRPYVLAWEGDSWASLAQELGRFASELEAMNEVQGEGPVPGTRVYLRFKPKKCRQGPASHTVVEGEALWDLAQYYGVQLRALCKRNRLEAGAVLAPGTVLKLR